MMMTTLLVLAGLLNDAKALPSTFDVGAEPKAVVASWYGAEFDGRPMANGQTFDKKDPTIVAHKTLPLGTRVLLRNPSNGRSLMAFVRDRGPYKKGRTFDLSEAAADRLGFKEEGVVRLEAIIFDAD